MNMNRVFSGLIISLSVLSTNLSYSFTPVNDICTYFKEKSIFKRPVPWVLGTLGAGLLTYSALANNQFDEKQVITWCRLGEKYFFGLDVPQDCIIARKYFERAVNQKICLEEQANALYWLGEIYYSGHGTDRDYIRSRKYYEQAISYKSFDPTLQANAWFTIGEIYYCSQGDDRDYTQAREYFYRTANQSDDPSAQKLALCRLGIIYYFGHGVDINYSLARTYFDQVANSFPFINAFAYAEACYWLSLIYYEGHGVDIDNIRARKYVEHVKRQNYNLIAQARAWYLLGRVYTYGKGVDVDNVLAQKYFELAAQQTADSITAQFAQKMLSINARIQELDRKEYLKSRTIRFNFVL